MTHDEFVEEVRTRARLASREDAERIICATLDTLAERLEHGIAYNLAAQLPPEIASCLKTDVPFERLSLDNFFRRANERGASAERARVVMQVLQEALTRMQMPAAFESLLSGGRDVSRGIISQLSK